MERFEKIKSLGRGAQGTVILVRRKVDNCMFVIKRIFLEETPAEERKDVMNEIKVRGGGGRGRAWELGGLSRDTRAYARRCISYLWPTCPFAPLPPPRRSSPWWRTPASWATTAPLWRTAR